MDWSFIPKAFLLVVGGIALLRFAGRKSISQMTVVTTVIMISIGAIIVQPLANQSAWKALGAAAIFIFVMWVIERLSIKYDAVEKWAQGFGQTVIMDGQINAENLKKMRMTVDQLEMRLRQKGIQKVSDVKTAVLEANGQLGYELMRHAQPLTVGEFERIMGNYLAGKPMSAFQNPLDTNLFNEVRNNRHSKDIDDRMQ
jgi:uncharacterized membrane protein YcaP (DUF421 family)